MARRPHNTDGAISAIKHPAVLDARRALGEVGGSEPTHYLLEGHDMALQALDSPAPVEAIFLRSPGPYAEHAAVMRKADQRNVACHLVGRGVFVRIHDLGYETSITALTLVKRSFVSEVIYPTAERDCLLVGERIQDPKNVGSLIRTADAWAVAGVAFSADSADPFSRGSVRASTGSVLRVPLAHVAHLRGYLERLKSRSVRIIGTSAHAPQRCWDADLSGPSALLMGNESVGLSDEIRSVCDVLVSIPMIGGAHSFNVAVAAGILLYERMRQKY